MRPTSGSAPPPPAYGVKEGRLLSLEKAYLGALSGWSGRRAAVGEPGGAASPSFLSLSRGRGPGAHLWWSVFVGVHRQGLATGYGCLKRFFKLGLSLYAQALLRGTLLAAGRPLQGETDQKLICPPGQPV